MGTLCREYFGADNADSEKLLQEISRYIISIRERRLYVTRLLKKTAFENSVSSRISTCLENVEENSCFISFTVKFMLIVKT